MASTVYYGKSTTAKNVSVKKVVIEGLNSAVITESDFLTSGDMLVVWFQEANTANSIFLDIYNGTIDNEIAINTDNGYQVVVPGLDDLNGVWCAGATCSFIYTINGNQATWNLMGISVGGIDSIGGVKVTTVFDDDETSVPTAYSVKQLFDSRDGGALQYVSSVTNDTQIGTLTLLNANGQVLNSVNIYIPEDIDTDTFRIYTNELFNNGPKMESGESISEANIGFEYPYITRIVPQNLKFKDFPLVKGEGKRGLYITDVEDIDGEDVETDILIYELVDSKGDSNINSKRNINIQAATSQNINLNSEVEVLENITCDKRLYSVLDVTPVIEENEIQSYTGEDVDLYLNILRLGWGDCIR